MIDVLRLNILRKALICNRRFAVGADRRGWGGPGQELQGGTKRLVGQPELGVRGRTLEKGMGAISCSCWGGGNAVSRSSQPTNPPPRLPTILGCPKTTYNPISLPRPNASPKWKKRNPPPPPSRSKQTGNPLPQLLGGSGLSLSPRAFVYKTLIPPGLLPTQTHETKGKARYPLVPQGEYVEFTLRRGFILGHPVSSWINCR